jgi:hypothetical protein
MTQVLAPLDAEPLKPQLPAPEWATPDSFGESLRNLIENGYTQCTVFRRAKEFLGLPVKRRPLAESATRAGLGEGAAALARV